MKLIITYYLIYELFNNKLTHHLFHFATVKYIFYRIKRCIIFTLYGKQVDIYLYIHALKKTLFNNIKILNKTNEINSKNKNYDIALKIFRYKALRFYSNNCNDLEALSTRLSHLKQSFSFYISIVSGVVSSFLVTIVFLMQGDYSNNIKQVAISNGLALIIFEIFGLILYGTIILIITLFFYFSYHRLSLYNNNFKDLFNEEEYNILIHILKEKYNIKVLK